MGTQHWTLDLPILYNTLAVHQAGIAHPLNDWSQHHIRQGFTWRPGSVSFSTLDLDTNEPVLVEVRDHYPAPPIARRMLKVPFEVGDTGVEVTSPVMDSWTLSIPPGDYTLFFAIEPVNTAEQEGQETSWRYHLTFVPAAEPVTAEILRADEELDPPTPLLMEAQPAT